MKTTEFMNRINRFFSLSVIVALAAAVSLTSCKDDDEDPDDHDHDHDHEHDETELITTMRLTFSDVNGQQTTASFSDPDGPGGNDPSIDTIALPFDGAPYTVNIEVLDESDPDDVEDITAEIEEEDNEHLFCFTPSSNNLSVAYNDEDENGLAVGLQTTWTLQDVFNGSIKIELKHQPGEKDGSCGIGETDIEVTFPVQGN